ncbi:MAG: hypothetical protein M3257_07910, partial [Actinomycetota bacterium]|nr:hypothetical protein [Actinomycetota bacterium]
MPVESGSHAVRATAGAAGSRTGGRRSAFLRDSLPAEVSDPALRTRLVDAVVAFEEISGFLAERRDRRLAAAETARARAFLANRKLVTFAEGEQCRVVPAPP